jgi:hypothetical protein
MQDQAHAHAMLTDTMRDERKTDERRAAAELEEAQAAWDESCVLA